MIDRPGARLTEVDPRLDVDLMPFVMSDETPLALPSNCQHRSCSAPLLR